MTEGEEGGAGALREAGPGDVEERVRPPPQNIAAAVPKPARDDIEEKFGKFEIKPLVGGDETFSLVSDTWSTDVLASDSETIEAVDRDVREERQDFHDQLLNRHLQELDRMQGAGTYRGGEAAGETFETASEAWSTDVLTSDSERLQEFDTDDSQSVARSDDAGRSELDEGAIALDSDLVLRPVDGLQPAAANTPDNITPRAHQSRSPVDIILAAIPDTASNAALHGNSMNRHGGVAAASTGGTQAAPPDSNVLSTVILKPIPVLPASLSLDSASTCGRDGNLKTLPVMQLNNNEDSPPSSAPPTIGFRPIESLNGSRNMDLLRGCTANSSGSSLLSADTRQSGRSSGNTASTSSRLSAACDVALLSQNLHVLTLDPSGSSSKPLNVNGGICSNDSSNLCGLKNPKLASGSSAEDSSLHLSTASLASSTSSSSELNGRINLHISESTVPDLGVGGVRDLVVSSVRELAVSGLRELVVSGVRELAVSGAKELVVSSVRELVVSSVRELAVSGAKELAVNGVRELAVSGCVRDGGEWCEGASGEWWYAPP